jgi:homoserine dehydrogenase
VRTIRIGLLGCGTVGGGFVRLLERNRSLIRQRAEAELEITRILVRDLEKRRDGIDRSLLTVRAEDVVRNGVDIVVELIGGTEPARSYIREALATRKHVITANKAVLAHAGRDLLELAAIHRVRLGFEASVCGAIPVVRVIRDGLAGNRVRSITAIVNGTCNYILNRMGESGAQFDDALREAQAKGLAEADATLDIDGEDAAQKITILARLAFGSLETRWLRREGIRQVTPEDHLRAASQGSVVRQVVSAREHDGTIELEVGPRLLPLQHPLARVRGEGNGVILQTDAAGELVLYGAGAGSLPSASSVLADLVEIARAL